MDLFPSFSGSQADETLLAAAGVLRRVGLEVGLELGSVGVQDIQADTWGT